MNDKAKGVLSYIPLVIGPLIVLFAFKDNNRKIVTHVYQSFVITGCYLILTVAITFVSVFSALLLGFSIPFLSLVVYGFLFAYVIMGIVKALNDDPNPKLPIVGDLTMSIFGKAIQSTPEVAQPTAPRFDPNTGQPITTPVAQANFDPNTGQPITNSTDQTTN